MRLFPPKIKTTKNNKKTKENKRKKQKAKQQVKNKEKKQKQQRKKKSWKPILENVPKLTNILLSRLSSIGTTVDTFSVAVYISKISFRESGYFCNIMNAFRLWKSYHAENCRTAEVIKHFINYSFFIDFKVFSYLISNSKSSFYYCWFTEYT